MSFTDDEIFAELCETGHSSPDLSSLRVTCLHTSWSSFHRQRPSTPMPPIRALLLALHKRRLRAWPGPRPVRPEFPSLRRYPDICEVL